MLALSQVSRLPRHGRLTCANRLARIRAARRVPQSNTSIEAREARAG